jgi:choline kinase
MPLTRNTPKPLLDMGNGLTLLEEQIESATSSGAINEIVLVIGYCADQIEAKIGMYRRDGLKISTIYNPFYEVSNNLMSLWLAKQEMSEDFMITNGDNLFTPDVFAGLHEECRDGIHLAVSRKSEFDFDDMKVRIEHDVIARVSKQIESQQAQAESPGLSCVRGERARMLFYRHLEILSHDRQYLNKFWLEVFNHLYQNGVSVIPWFFDASSKWQEVDFHSDVNRLKNLLQEKSSLLKYIPQNEAI